MSEEDYQECLKCNSKTVRHDRVKGNVKCFNCGYVVESHFQTYEQEVNNYENDPDQTKKMRGLVQEGKDCKIKIGNVFIDDQPKKKRKGEEDNSKTALKWLRNHCAEFEFDNRNIYEIEIYYNILVNIDQQRNMVLANGIPVANGNVILPIGKTGGSGGSSAAQKEAGLKSLQRKAVLAIFLFLKSMKMTEDDPEATLQQICYTTCVSYGEVTQLIKQIKEQNFKDKEKIAAILYKQDLLTFAEMYSKQAGLAEDDLKGYLALCQQIKDNDISNGEQLQTKAAAALLVVFKLSNSPQLAGKGLNELHNISGKSEGTIKKYFDGPLQANIVFLLETMKYQQYNWKHYSYLVGG